MRAVLLLLLAACTPVPEIAPELRAAGDAARAAWQAAGLPAHDGDCDVSAFSVRTPDAPGFEEACHVRVESAYGCLTWTDNGAIFRVRQRPVLVIAPWWHPEPTIVVHELMHAMVRCSRLRNTLDLGDSRHSDPRVWQAAGGDSSVQVQALKLLGGQ